jgi:hypothetical protein
MSNNIGRVYAVSVALILAAAIHFCIYLGLLVWSGTKCAFLAGCPSWTIPGIIETYFIFGVLQVIIVFVLVSCISLPSPMNYFRFVQDDRRTAGKPFSSASRSVGTSAILGASIVASALNIFIGLVYEDVSKIPHQYFMHVSSTFLYAILDLMMIWLVAGLCQLFVDPDLHYSATREEKTKYKQFRMAVWCTMGRILVGILYLVLQFGVDYVIRASSTSPDQTYLSIHMYGAFTLIFLSILYKVYMVQLTQAINLIKIRNLFK